MPSVLRTVSCSAILLGAAATASAASGLSGGDLFVLNSASTKNALSISGQPDVLIANVSVNSSNGTAATIGGSAVVNSVAVKTVGGLKVINTATFNGVSASLPSPVADPYAGKFSMALPMNTPNLGTLNANGTQTVNPGYYSGGIKLNAGSNVTFNPGVYYLGNGFDASSSCTLSGSGVIFIILAGSVNTSGSAVMNLSPPQSGPYANVTFAQPATNMNAMSFTGGANSVITGTIYAPKALIKLAGASVLVNKGPRLGDIIVGDTVSIQGQGLLQIGDDIWHKTLAPPALTSLYD